MIFVSFVCVGFGLATQQNFLVFPLYTSLIILLVLSTFWSSGVIWRFQLKEMLWSSLSDAIPPSSSLLTFIVLSCFVILKEQGLQRQVIPFGLISMSFLSCNLPWQRGQSKVINLLVSFCSWLKWIVVGSSSDSSKSSGIGCFFHFTHWSFWWHYYILDTWLRIS